MGIFLYLQYRRHKSSAVTKLRWFIIKKLQSFSKARRKIEPSKSDTMWGQESLSATVIPEETMESKLADETPRTRPLTESKQQSESQPEAISSMEVGVSESVDTLEELVDQMEIEISDHGEDGDSEETMGEESLDESPSNSSTQKEIEEASEKSGEKIQSSTTVSSGVAGAEKSGAKVKPEVQFSRKRRHSSTRLDKAEFTPISLDNQLSDDEIIELMELLQVLE